MTIIRALSGWIVFAIVGSFADSRIAAVAALVTAVVSLLLGIRGTRSLAANVIESSTVVYFVLLVGVSFMSLHLSHLNSWVAAASALWLGLTVAITLAIRRPFTLAIAKSEAPREIWDLPEFYRFNVDITRAWMISFLVSGVVIVVLTASGVGATGLAAVIQVVAIVAAIVYMRRRQDGLRASLGDPDFA